MQHICTCLRICSNPYSDSSLIHSAIIGDLNLDCFNTRTPWDETFHCKLSYTCRGEGVARRGFCFLVFLQLVNQFLRMKSVKSFQRCWRSFESKVNSSFQWLSRNWQCSADLTSPKTDVKSSDSSYHKNNELPWMRSSYAEEILNAAFTDPNSALAEVAVFCWFVHKIK